jgi:hypothetical protein
MMKQKEKSVNGLTAGVEMLMKKNKVLLACMIISLLTSDKSRLTTIKDGVPLQLQEQ